MIVLGGPNECKIPSWVNLMAVSAVTSFVTLFNGKLVIFSTQIRNYCVHLDELGNGLAHSIENSSHRFLNGWFRCV